MRPTKYKPEYADTLIELMSEGASIEEICLELRVCKQTLYNWFEQYPELLDAKKTGLDFAHGWWMREGRKNLQNKEFNYGGWYMNMKNRFGWTDRQHIEQKQTNIDLSGLTTEEIKDLLNE